MRTLPGKIIVKAQSDQKETLTYKSLKLYVPNRSLLNENGRVSNLTLCEVIVSNEREIGVGDLLVLGHNSLNNAATLISKEDGVITCAIPVDRWILGKLGEKGELKPLYGNTICKRIGGTQSSIIINPFAKTEENKVIVLSVAPEVPDLMEGQTAIIHKMADYEIFYSIDGEEKSSVIVYQNDIVAILN